MEASVNFSLVRNGFPPEFAELLRRCLIASLPSHPTPLFSLLRNRSSEAVADLTPMDLPVSDLSPIKDAVASFSCSHCDAEAVHKVAQVLLPGLATACIDSTTGDFFRTPAFVAVDLRKEMVDYLNLRSETYISNLLLLDQVSSDAPDLPPDEPADIVADLIEDFAASKRNILSRFSGWILSDSREDKIDEFVHEMETNRFWMTDRREAVAEVLLRNLDYKNESHCSMRFEDERQLAEHMRGCTFRPVGCANEGCKVKFSALHAEHHDSVCAYKVLPCDQKCPEMILRREMDRHCVTVCKMKLMNCPFYQVGCQLAIPQCMLQQHCRDQLQTHLISVLPLVHRGDEGSEDDWRERAKALEKAQGEDELSEALNVRALAAAIRNLEAKMMMKKSGEDDTNHSS